jgi:hypothetical protein
MKLFLTIAGGAEPKPLRKLLRVVVYTRKLYPKRQGSQSPESCQEFARIC